MEIFEEDVLNAMKPDMWYSPSQLSMKIGISSASVKFHLYSLRAKSMVHDQPRNGKTYFKVGPAPVIFPMENKFKPLTAKNIASHLGMREGCNEFWKWESKHV